MSYSLESAGRVARLRLALVFFAVLGLLAVTALLPVALPLLPMFAVLGLHGLGVASAFWRLRQGDCGSDALHFVELAADALLIAALVWLSGGYANPFISLLLAPLLLAATLLPQVFAWGMAVWVVALYSLLALWYQPLEVRAGADAMINLHLAGMWLSFVLIVLIVAAALVRLSASLRAHEQALGEARELALRDERLFLLGMQAASAAHDLATPLATLRLTLDDLAEEYAGDDELDAPLTRMRQQADRLRAALDRLASSGRSPEGAAVALDHWLHELFEHWRQTHPGTHASLVLTNGAAPAVLTRHWLVSALTTLLDNAAEVSATVALTVSWDAGWLRLRVTDRGPGLNAMPAKVDRWGVGLQLVRAQVQRSGGSLNLSAGEEGCGVVAELALPLEALT
jgi:two-component system sensor histidine kinase RegB